MIFLSDISKRIYTIMTIFDLTGMLQAGRLSTKNDTHH